MHGLEIHVSQLYYTSVSYIIEASQAYIHIVQHNWNYKIG